MKITSTHYQAMRNAIEPLAPKIADHFKAITEKETAQNPALRTRWDALFASGFMAHNCSALYAYLNDDAIDTALRSIMREINLPEIAA